jgi:hypothetical protein
VNAATDVLPLVPVMAAMACGWRGKIFAAARASASRAFGTFTNGASAGNPTGMLSAIAAAAPAASACATNCEPSALVPGTATNRSPFFTLRLSAVTPVTSNAAKRWARAASSVTRSESFMTWFFILIPRPARGWDQKDGSCLTGCLM